MDRLRSVGSWLFEAGRDTNFPQEAIDQLGLVRQARQQHLHRFDVIGDYVPDLIDVAHAAGAEQAKHFISAITSR